MPSYQMDHWWKTFQPNEKAGKENQTILEKDPSDPKKRKTLSKMKI